MFQYRVKVRGKTYLWGGEQVIEGFFDQAHLIVRVDEMGESLVIWQKSVDFNNPVVKRIGTLKRGEALTINLRTLSGVWAETTSEAVDSNVDCMIASRF